MPLKGLTDEQLEVVTHKGNLLLTACPGAGKTKTLVSKIAYLLEKGVCIKKKRIIAITYTNVAAETILDRLDKYGVDSAHLWVGTIHSFCLEWVLKPYLGYSDRLSKGFRIIDEYEQRKLLNTIKSKFNIGLFDSIPTLLNEDFRINANLGSNYYEAASEYHQVLRANKWIDFDLILTISLNMLRTYSSISGRLSELFEAVMVDEYQDTNQQQHDILASIIRHGKTEITFIGDIDQAIYTGLGAVVKDIKEIQSEFALDDITEKNLSGCYRSTQSIIDFYRSFQDNKIKINSLANIDQTNTGVFYNNDIHRDQLGTFIGDIINKHISEGVRLSEMIVLAPQWTDVIKLGVSLKQAMPHLEFNAPGISPIPKSQDNPWFNLVRLFLTAINSDNYSRRRRLAARVVEDIEGMGLSLSKYDNPIKQVLKTVNSINPRTDGEIEPFIDSLVSCFTEKLNCFVDKNYQALEAKTSLIEATSLRIAQYNLQNDASKLTSYFNNSHGIEVASCHSAKGEEYDVVIVTGLVNGKLPHWNDIINQSDAHADYMARRLLYVVSSRARKFLYLISEKGHTTRKGAALVPTTQLLQAIATL